MMITTAMRNQGENGVLCFAIPFVRRIYPLLFPLLLSHDDENKIPLLRPFTDMSYDFSLCSFLLAFTSPYLASYCLACGRDRKKKKGNTFPVRNTYKKINKGTCFSGDWRTSRW
ncbi:hypothetical protein F5Y06DRAFT_254886 [Hypoxylon sp. FL0890]|nr:hypothetical protein F5Y06DRAFT_254886 [Hypoxylon sp. FL0890]